MGIFRDIKLLFREAEYLDDILKDNKEDIGFIFPEHLALDTSIRSPGKLEIILKYLFGVDKPREGFNWNEIIRIDDSNYHPGEEWFFVNGIMTDFFAATLNGRALSQMFGRPIHLLYNPTNGFVADIAESAIGRTFDGDVSITEDLTKRVSDCLSRHKHAVIIGHSQGGIIVSNMVRMLRENYPKYFYANKVEVYTFAGAQDQLEDNNSIYCEHFANECDFISRIGVMEFSDKISGHLFVRESATGHLFNTHYAEAFIRGDYCNRRSRLHKYLVDELNPIRS